MKLYTSGASPFGRKVKIVARETGLVERIEQIDQALTPIAPSSAVVAANPLGKIPCLVTDDGTALHDSRVICEHLDGLHDGPKVFPATGPARLRALTLQALGDGMLDAAVGTRYETFLRPEPQRWPEWITAQKAKVARALDRLESEPAQLEGLTIGTITIGCALGYLDFRFADDHWRHGRQRLAAWYEGIAGRASFEATRPA
jgi:glutathione S-transferase